MTMDYMTRRILKRARTWATFVIAWVDICLEEDRFSNGEFSLLKRFSNNISETLDCLNLAETEIKDDEDKEAE